MSFWIYQKNGNVAEKLIALKLTGKNGLLARYLQKLPLEDEAISWNWEEQQILDMALSDVPENAVILLDLMPEGLNRTCLYRLRSISGSSETDSSDLVLACHLFYQGLTTPGQRSVPWEDPALKGTPVSQRVLMEAIHLSGGTRNGRYYWGAPKMNIGAAVCPAASPVTA